MYICVCKRKVCEFEKIRPCLKEKREVSIILPTYNEEGNINRLVDSLKNYLKSYDYEIVVVDDNSKDRTPKIIDDLAKKDGVIALHRYGIKGIFSAIQDGIKLCRGKVVVIMDADFSHPPHTVPKLLEQIEAYDIVSGSRFIKGGGIDSPFFHKIATIAFNSVVRFFMGIKIKDLTGGFHAIKKEKFMQLRFKYPSIWGEFDLELFYLAHKKWFKIKELPFKYVYRLEGKTKSPNLFKYAITYWKRVFELRLFR